MNARHAKEEACWVYKSAGRFNRVESRVMWMFRWDEDGCGEMRKLVAMQGSS